MVSKKILGVAIAAALASQGAFATIDLSAKTGAVKFAKETILTTDIPTSGTLSGKVVVAVTGTELQLQNPIGFGVTASTHAFVRYDLTNAVFNTAVASGNGSTTGDLRTAVANGISSVTVAQGGQIGDSYVILDVTAGSAGLSQTDVVTLNIAGLALSSSLSDVTFGFNHYSTSIASVGATAPAGALKTYGPYAGVSVIEDLKTTITAGTDLVADVGAATPFNLFTGAATSGVLGTARFEYADAAALTPTGALANTVALYDTAAGKSSLAVTGDLGWTAGADGAGAAAATAARLVFGAVNSDTGATATSATPTAKLTTLTGASVSIGAAAFNITATIAGSNAVPAGSYSLTFTPAKITGRQYAPSSKTGALANITRNGATIQVPYLTTNAGLNQKVVLVNRSNLTAPYKVSFTAENGVTATTKLLGTETLAPKQTLVLKASDLVTLTGGSRTAATITVTAPKTQVDAATQTVVTDPASVSFGSNDTVNLDVQ